MSGRAGVAAGRKLELRREVPARSLDTVRVAGVLNKTETFPSMELRH